MNDYTKHARIHIGDVKAMFQFTQHIQIIYSVCEEYLLKNCLTDPELQAVCRPGQAFGSPGESLTAYSEGRNQEDGESVHLAPSG